jgi:hypothetical protein
MNPQDKNAGNLGDLLKHFWLLELVAKILKKKPRKIAYIESHAGGGIYWLTQTRIKEIARNRHRIHPDSRRWQTFDRLQSRLKEGRYIGSFALVFNFLKEFPGIKVAGKLWEYETEANARIWDNLPILIPIDRKDIAIRKKKSHPQGVARICRRFLKQGYIVIWLCDPFWGGDKDQDRAWANLLNIEGTYGILFAYCAGNSRKQGAAKFDYPRVTGLDRPPDRRIDDNIRSYALYFTPVARAFLGAR